MLLDPFAYPKHVLEEEGEQGFRPLQIHNPECEWVSVVGKVLSSSDVIIKIFAQDGSFCYSHMRFGFYHVFETENEADWCAVSDPMNFDHAIILISEFDFAGPKEMFEGAIRPLSFDFREV